MAKNRYTRALKVLKSSQVDEKLQILEALPTNNTTGLYVVEPAIINTVTVPGEVDRTADFTQDGDGSEGYSGNDTTGLFLSDGTILTIEPPGDTSYILGPMSAMWYAWGNFTQIGYIRQSDRRMVNLARITGQLGSWDGSSNFTSYGQLTLEQAVFFQNTPKLNGADNDTPNYRAFYPGPPSNTADGFGRYLAVITGTTKATEREETQRTPDVMGDAESQGYPWEKRKEEEQDKNDKLMQTILNAAMLGLDIAAVVALLFPELASSAAGAAILGSKLRYVAKFGRALSRLNPFKRSPKPKITYGNRPTKARYGDGAKPKDPMDKVLRDINRANAASPSKGSSFTRGDNIRGPYSDVKAQSRPGSGKYKSSSRNYDPKNNPSFGSRRGTRKFNNSYEYDTNKILLEQINNYLLETATAVPSLSGGMEAADGYVDKVSKTSSPDQLEKASNDANNIAKEGGKGLSDSDLAKIDKDAETEAKRLTNFNIDNPGSMDSDQLLSALDLIYEVDPDWLNDTFDKLDSLIPQNELDKLNQEYEDKETERETERETIQSQLDAHDENYNEYGGGGWTENGVRYAGSVNWGAQFTKQNFKSSGQSFSEYNSVRERLGFFNNNSGPDEYGRYHPGVGPLSILDAKDNGHQPEQFTGVAYEIVSRSYKLTEIRSNKNFPQPGQNIYYTKEDYDEAVFLEAEYGRIFAEYINFWEGPGGFDELRKEAWAFDDRSQELGRQDARDAKKRRDELQSKLDNLGTGDKYNDEYSDKIDELYRPFFVAVMKDWNEFNQGEDINDDPFGIKDYVNQDGSMSEADKKRLKAYLSKMGPEYAKIAAIPVAVGLLATPAGQVALAAGAAAVTTLLIQAGINVGSTAGTGDSADYDNPYKRERDAVETAKKAEADRKGDAREKGTSEAEKQEVADADQQLQDAEQEATDAEASGDSDRIDRAYDNYTKARNNRTRVTKKWRTNRKNQKTESYKPKFLKNRERKNVTEIVTPKQKRILREIKKPVQVKEMPTKFKVKPTGRKNKSVGAELMKPIESPKAFKPDPAIWKAGHKKYNEISSQDKKNHVLELVGAAEHHWSTLIERSDRERQEKVNEAMAQEFDREMEKLYEKYQKKETKVDKVIQSIKTASLDNPDIKPIHPDNPPPERVNGYHPKYGQKYKHDKLDPHSAEFMPATGNPEIDANVKKATNTKEKARKLKVLLGNRKKISESMTTASLMSTTLPAEPDIIQDSLPSTTITSADNTGDPTENGLVPRVQSFQVTDSSKTDTITVTISGSFNTKTVDGDVIDDKISVGVLVGGTYVGNYLKHGLGNGTHTVSIPPRFQKAGVKFDAIQVTAFQGGSGAQSGTVNITGVGLKRVKPMNVFVSLDSPEATNFIRTDPTMQGLSAEDRKKKLLDMLDAGDEYLLKYLGMIGSKARPSDTTMPDSWDQAQSQPGPDSGTMRNLRPSGVERSDKNMTWDDHMQEYVPNIGPGDLLKKASSGSGDTQIASAKGPYGTPGADKPYVRKGYKDKKGKFVDFDNPATWPSIVQKAGYEPEGEVLSEKKKLKSPKDITKKIPGYYDGKPAPLGFPMQEPPKMKNGFHPDLVDGKKIANRFNRLDPQSAKAMPPSGNPHIDKKVRAAAKKPK
jgi:hypothetical protein